MASPAFEWTPYGGFGALPYDIWLNVCEQLSIDDLRKVVVLSSSFIPLVQKIYENRRHIVHNLQLLDAPQSGFNNHDASMQWLSIDFLLSGKLAVLSYVENSKSLVLLASSSRLNLTNLVDYGAIPVQPGDFQEFSDMCISRKDGTIFIGWSDCIYCIEPTSLWVLSKIELSEDIGHITHDEFDDEIYVTTVSQILVFPASGKSDRSPIRAFPLSVIAIAVGRNFFCCGVLGEEGDLVQICSKTTGSVMKYYAFGALPEAPKWNIIDIMVDRLDRIFIADLRDNGVMVIDSNVRMLHEFGDGALTGVSSMRLRDDGLIAVFEHPDSVSFFQ